MFSSLSSLESSNLVKRLLTEPIFQGRRELGSLARIRCPRILDGLVPYNSQVFDNSCAGAETLKNNMNPTTVALALRFTIRDLTCGYANINEV